MLLKCKAFSKLGDEAASEAGRRHRKACHLKALGSILQHFARQYGASQKFKSQSAADSRGRSTCSDTLSLPCSARPRSLMVAPRVASRVWKVPMKAKDNAGWGGTCTTSKRQVKSAQHGTRAVQGHPEGVWRLMRPARKYTQRREGQGNVQPRLSTLILPSFGALPRHGFRRGKVVEQAGRGRQIL